MSNQQFSDKERNALTTLKNVIEDYDERIRHLNKVMDNILHYGGQGQPDVESTMQAIQLLTDVSQDKDYGSISRLDAALNAYLETIKKHLQ